MEILCAVTQGLGMPSMDYTISDLPNTSRKLRSPVERFWSRGTVSKPLRRRRGARCANEREVKREVTLTEGGEGCSSM